MRKFEAGAFDDVYERELELTVGARWSDRVLVSDVSGSDHLFLRYQHCIKERLHWRFSEAPAALMWSRLIHEPTHRDRGEIDMRDGAEIAIG